VKVAVYSAYQHTLLDPYFLYDGQPDSLSDWLESHNVTVIPLKSRLYNKIFATSQAAQNPSILSIGSGAFMRLEIPWLMQARGWSDQVVLYTDCDVMFTQPLELDNAACQLFSAAPEHHQHDYTNINSGIMLMNIPNLATTSPQFFHFVENNLSALANLDYDQTAYRVYYHLEWDRLQPEYNWKPYWGENPGARIIHFHGPKPTDIDRAQRGELTAKNQELVGENYYGYTATWRQYWDEAQDWPALCKDVDEQPAAAQQPEGVTSGFNPLETRLSPSDLQKAAALKSSGFAELCTACEVKGICDWRAVKGNLILWLFSNLKDPLAYIAVSDFFSILKDHVMEELYLRYASGLEPRSPNVLKRWGKNLYLQGKLEQAQEKYLSVLAIDPQEADVLLALGIIHYELQDYPAAQKYLQQVLVNHPADPDARLGLQLIEEKLKKLPHGEQG